MLRRFRKLSPGTSVPNGCGLLAHEVADAVFEICRAADLVGLDITEVSPPLDNSGATVQVAAHILLNAMAGVSDRAKGKSSAFVTPR